jgi:cytochrome c biogenesis protein CcdA
VGPTLGAAIGLAASGGSASSAATVMAVFSLGAVLPLMAVGLLGRSLLVRHRARLAQAGDVGRKLMGGSLLVVGVLVLTGLDKALEAWLLGLAPTWLVGLTTRF